MNNKLNAQEMYGFCSQLALILKSGLPLYEGLSSIAAHDKDSAYIQKIADDLQAGESFYSALKNRACFDETFLAMISVGEASGSLDKVMEANAVYYQRMQQTNEKIRQVILYPILLGTLLLAVMAIVLVFILPIFQNLLQQVNRSLPSFSLTLMSFAKSIGMFGFFAFLVLFLVAVFWYLHQKSNQLQYQFPFMKDLHYKLGVSQMTFALSLLLSSGYHLEDTFELLMKMTKEKKIQEKLKQCQNDIQKGKTFEDALIDNTLYEGIEEKILYAGCKSGNAELALKQLAALQEESVEEDIIQRLNRLEPTMVAILSMFVALLLLSIVLPLLSILSSIG